MSVVFKCDRCGEIFNRKVPDINDCYGTANSILFLDCTVERNRFGLGEEPIQLCPSCMKQLNDWLTPDEQKPDTGNKNEWNSIYNCVSLRNGRIMSCSDDAMVGVARVHIEKEH